MNCSARGMILRVADSTHTDNVSSPSLCGEHAQNTSATSYIQNILPLEKLRVPEDRVAVGASADPVLQHLLVDAWSRTQSS